ncbi:MAG TPA: helix-turn-helix domain-containing protein [Nocardioidaceae bacterium]|nr:helix-turn-helix domain-containing protein [Nocardioidaceae bacterium]
MSTDYLELLARDASAVEYEAPVREARAGGEPQAVVEQLEHGKLLALRIRESLIDRRRREDDLTALSDTAYDLARLSDLDAVLEAIVHRARQLLHTDITYLTMNDPDGGDTYMRVTDGSTSARFQQVRLAMGEGLGGRVAQNAMPYSTPSYFTDARFNHTTAIDDAVAEEGLVAILGVPLQLGAHVIGVLYAANRSERPFSRSEVALLSSLAAHAAAAIDKARLLAEARSALEELRTANLLLSQRGRSVERASEAHDLMAQVVLRGGGVEDIGAAIVEVLGGTLVVLDDEGRELASIGSAERDDPQLVSAAIAASRASGRCAVCPDDARLVAVTAGQQGFGALVLHRDQPLDDADQRILERAAVVTALLLLSLRSGVEAENRVRGDLLDDLLRSSGDDAESPSSLTERARRLGCDLEQPHVVLVVAAEDADRQRTLEATARIATRAGGLSASFEGRPVLILPDSDPASRARSLATELTGTVGCPVTVGAAGPSQGVGALSRTHAEAVRCLTALRTLGRDGDGAALHELGFVGLVLGEEPDVPGFVATVLGPLLDYDRRRSTGLVATLAAYFDNGASLARTGEALHVHVNTVSQRLDRIGKLIGRDWQDPDRRLELQVALRLHRVSSGR